MDCVNWECKICTFNNEFVAFCLPVSEGRIFCKVCESCHSLKEIVTDVNQRTGQYLCIRCTLLNPRSRHYCSACGSWLLFVSESPPESEQLQSELSFLSLTSRSLSDVDEDNENNEEMIDLMLRFSFTKLEHSANFIKLREQPEFRDFDPNDLAEAVRSCGDQLDYVDFVSAYFKNECPICFDSFPRHKVLQMASCQCKLCFSCFRNFVSASLDNNDHVSHLQCPICNTPDSENEAELENYFEYLLIQVKSFQHAEIRFEADKINMLEQRLRDWNLMRDPNFRWCSHCPNGVVLSEQMRGLKFQCNQCSKYTCKQCRKQWREQHEKISCEQFQQWLVENDPDYQAKGVAAFLENNGIECPKCKFKYALAKGGCMHFTCRPPCRAEFCSGCGGFFKRLHGRGLVCEHPRDCLFYLRDFTVRSLQKLLSDHGVQYETAAEGATSGTCNVMEQKESGNLVDEACGRPVEGHAKLCGKHYKEYLVSLINKNRLDPVEVMDVEQLKETCRRHKIEVQSSISTDATALRALIVRQVPLRS
ncbi:hypothetical protein BOX15_Mlig033604g2 [Macrostomum lignano]|uniref:RING-type domain-containing protein n=1 Tax=Macrostomum lignano TaxID=282301 RepID=A0A267FYV6_9PLAT|nr:hypothetical protein BOX15_Mlig033604g2 [Macrostomum lignano]